MPKANIQKRRESSVGFHFLNLHQCCPRKFYFKYLKRWVPSVTHPALVQGSAFHEGKARYYTSRFTNKARKIQDAVDVAMNILEESKLELTSESYRELYARLPVLLPSWIEARGEADLRDYHFIAVEHELQVPIEGTPYVMTVRQDAIVQSIQLALIYIMETKTSGFSHKLTTLAVSLGDQATMYLMAAKKVLNLDVYGVIPDVSYWNSRSVDPSKIQHLRDEIVCRDDFALKAFERGLAQQLSELNQKVEAYKQGADPFVAFPRNSHYCVSYAHECEYCRFCYQDCERSHAIPDGFKLDKAVRSLTSNVEDILAIS